MNAIGIGKFYSNQGANNAMDGLNCLSPSVSKNINFSNPSTWYKLKATYLSLGYSLDHSLLENSSLANAYSGLSSALWIIPFKSRYSIGLSISPYNNQKVSIVDMDTLSYIAFNDTLAISHTFKRYGGLLSFNIGSSYQVTQKTSIGFITRVIFGSSRQSEFISFSGSDILKTSRSRYTGLISDFYLTIKLYDDISLHSSFKTTLKPIEIAQLDKHLFDDVNSNGFHDWISPYFDFPFPDSVNLYPEYRWKNIHSPTGLQFGLSKSFNKNSSLAFEWHAINDSPKEIDRIYLPLNNWISNTNSFVLTVSRFASITSLNLIDRFSVRSGIKYSSYLLNNDKKSIQEYGCSLGGGFKFKPIANQIDFNFCFGYREYPMESEKELFQQLQVSLSLADMWFIKRRQK